MIINHSFFRDWRLDALAVSKGQRQVLHDSIKGDRLCLEEDLYHSYW
jgi:hypothetical protein